MEIKDNAFSRQFETTLNGKLVALEYSTQEKKIFLSKIILPEGFDDEIFIDEFIKTILDHIEVQKLKVVPVFPRIAKFIKLNPRYKDLLPPGIKI